MNKLFLMSVITLLGAWSLTFAQEIPQSEVPSVIANRFQQDFPEAKDIEWERKGDFYEVEFEIGRPDKDHKIRYDAQANVLRHKAEITKQDLPAEIAQILDTDYPAYRIKDIKKIVDGNTTLYTLEAKTPIEEWELVFDSQGRLLSKIPD